MNSKKTLTDMANYVHHNIDIVCDVKYDKKKGYIASINLGHFTFGNSDRLGQWAVERLHEELEFYVKTSLEYRELKEENSNLLKDVINLKVRFFDAYIGKSKDPR